MSKPYWLIDSEENKKYTESTWYRSIGIENFVKKVEEKHKIVAVTFSGNNIGFVLDSKDNIKDIFDRETSNNDYEKVQKL